MQKKDTIQDKDNERDPLISYFRTLEKEVPEADIEKRWNALMQNVNREPVSKRHRYLRIYMLAADRKSTRLNSSHQPQSRMPSSA